MKSNHFSNELIIKWLKMKILGILEFAVLTNLLISLICQAPFQQECFFKASVPTTAAAAATITLRMTASQHFF